MTKKIYINLVVFLAVINILFMPNIFAVEDTTNITQNINEQSLESVTNVENNEKENIEMKNENKFTEEEIKQVEELNNIIKELVKSIKSKLKTIDQKVEYIRTIEEYKNYPAIRLNVDTPIFGVASVINSKLKIKQEVSATDIAKSYSIRNIIKNNSIKLPDKYIAGIIVSTKDVKFDENISITDANTSVIKLMQYSKTVDNVIEFLNSQTNKIFKGYIEKSKSETIYEIKRNLDKLNENLLSQDEKILTLHILLTSNDKENFEKQIETFDSISEKVKESERKINNILISNEELVIVQKNVLELESAMIDFSIELDKFLEKAKENIDEKQILLGVQNELMSRKELLDKIVENSVVKKVVKNYYDYNLELTQNNKNINVDSNIDENIDNSANTPEFEETNINSENDEVSENEIQTIEEIKVYEVVSENILKDIEEKILNVINEKVKYYIVDMEKEINNEESLNLNNHNNETVGNADVENANEGVVEADSLDKDISIEEKNQIVKDCVKLYKEFIVKENKFYLDNINSTLKNTTSKTADLSKYTKSDILNEIRYIYLELPSSLENYLDSTNLDRIIETKALSNSFSKELNNLLNTYIKVSNIYNELNVENVKKNA